jgi:hypothetical protein
MRASLGGYRLARKLRRAGKACLAATIKERSNLDAGLDGRGPVPPRDQRPLAIEPSAAKV